MNLRAIIFLGASLCMLAQFKNPVMVYSMPQSIEIKNFEDQEKSSLNEIKDFNEAITKLFDQALNKYSSTMFDQNTLGSQIKQIFGQNKASSNRFMFPERAALIESDSIRQLYKSLMKAQSSEFNDLRQINPNDTYLYNSSI